MPGDNDLQRRTEEFLKSKRSSGALESVPGVAPRPRFSAFRPDHLERALEVTDRFTALADAQAGDTGLESVLEEAERIAATEDLDLVKHALMVFITHHPEGSRLPIPPLEEREPEILPTPRPPAEPGLEALGDPEAQLAWFREDPSANEHHEHWHLVYPSQGVGGRRKDRQGELFCYMHQQMIARYDTERLSVGLPRVEMLRDYRAPISEGYDPGPLLRDIFPARPPGLRLADIPLGNGSTYSVQEHEIRRDRLFDAVERGDFEGGDGATVPVELDLLGATAEASIDSVSSTVPGRPPSPFSFYGQHHNFGHVLLAGVHDPTDPNSGVMGSVQLAIRDPVFYRWHKLVDEVSFRWQELQPPHDLSDAPPVLIRKGLGDATPESQSPDIILCFDEQIPGAGDAGFDGQAFGEATFGGEHWDEDFSTGDLTTGGLQTMMLERESQGVTISYLDQKEFSYFLRVENRVDATTEVTLRIFLVVADEAEDRRMWIEMDKFRHTLQPSQRAVIFRPAARASVIRKPAMKPPTPVTTTRANAEENYCNCGWPYNLLLPRGTREGMAFRLLVMVTDWEQDRVAHDSACGSLSFCGTRDRYPDRRGMGYPFDRPFSAERSIMQTIVEQDNMAARDITIQWVDG